MVLSVSLVRELQSEDKLWLAFGAGRSFRYLAAHEIEAGLEREKACVLPVFHALTGCDTMSSFARRGKKTACEDTARTHRGAAAAAVLCTA